MLSQQSRLECSVYTLFLCLQILDSILFSLSLLRLFFRLSSPRLPIFFSFFFVFRLLLFLLLVRDSHRSASLSFFFSYIQPRPVSSFSCLCVSLSPSCIWPEGAFNWHPHSIFCQTGSQALSVDNWNGTKKEEEKEKPENTEKRETAN